MIQIIPAIDIIEGKCVRLDQGKFSSTKIYHENPIEVAKNFEGGGLKRLHLVDLDGARAGKIINFKILEKIASATKLIIDFGGGVTSDENLKIAFNSGANLITGGSIAVKEEELFSSWIAHYGSEKIILGADVRDKKIAISGWKENSEHNIFDFIKGYQKKGIKYVISTDILKDGALKGPSFDLYKEIQDKVPDINIIASGGVSCIDDINLLDEMKIYGVIIGKAIYEGKIQIPELLSFL